MRHITCLNGMFFKLKVLYFPHKVKQSGGKRELRLKWAHACPASSALCSFSSTAKEADAGENRATKSVKVRTEFLN